MSVSAHLLESQAEKDWLEKSTGEFAPFFKEFLQQDTPVNKIENFIELFNSTPTMFTHLTKANKEVLLQLKKGRHSVIHCPISNRLLGNGLLDIEALNTQHIQWSIATDGLSSNFTLDLFEEMKHALFMHHHIDLKELADILLINATKTAADNLNLNKGEIAVGKDADFIVLQNQDAKDEELALNILLHQREISHVIINSKLIKGK